MPKNKPSANKTPSNERKPTVILQDGTILYDDQAKPVTPTPEEELRVVKDLHEHCDQYRRWLNVRSDDDILPAYQKILAYPGDRFTPTCVGKTTAARLASA